MGFNFRIASLIYVLKYNIFFEMKTKLNIIGKNLKRGVRPRGAARAVDEI